MLKNSIENHVFSNYFGFGLGRAGGNEGYLGILKEAIELVLKFKNWIFSSSKMATDLSFHFTKETPANQMFNDVKSLNKFDDENFKKFLNLVLHFLSGSSDVEEFQTNLELFSQELGASLTPLKNITKTLLIFFKHAVKQHLSPQFVKDDMEKLGLSQEKLQHIEEAWKSNLISISRNAIAQTFMVNPLVDMEWKFGVTSASNDMKIIGNSFLQLKLIVDKGGKKENVYMELTLPQFYSFLHEMEKARTALEYLS